MRARSVLEFAPRHDLDSAKAGSKAREFGTAGSAPVPQGTAVQQRMTVERTDLMERERAGFDLDCLYFRLIALKLIWPSAPIVAWSNAICVEGEPALNTVCAERDLALTSISSAEEDVRKPFSLELIICVSKTTKAVHHSLVPLSRFSDDSSSRWIRDCCDLHVDS